MSAGNVEKKNVLFVLTSHDQLGTTGKKTGYDLGETARVWHIMCEAGFGVEFATIKGGLPPADNINKDDPQQLAFLNSEAVQTALQSAPSLREVPIDRYDAIYFPGGHGTMWDFPEDPNVQDVVRGIYERGGIVAAVCHGPAALLNVNLTDDSLLIAGKRMAAFTDEEERAMALDQVVPFLLASELAKRGARLVQAGKSQPQIVVDGRLITGQNPASAVLVGEELAKALYHKPVRREALTPEPGL